MELLGSYYIAIDGCELRTTLVVHEEQSIGGSECLSVQRRN